MNLQTKQILFEYQVANENMSHLSFDLLGYGTEWGHAIYNKHMDGMAVARNLVLPYSYLSVLQLIQKDDSSSQKGYQYFYALDYYNIKGETPLSKNLMKQDIFERIIDSYWNQNPLLVLAALRTTSN